MPRILLIFLIFIFLPQTAIAITGDDTAPGDACNNYGSVRMSGSADGGNAGGYILSCDGTTWRALSRSETPILNTHVANKAYVDTAVAAAGGGGIGDIEVIEATGNFTVPAGVTKIKANIIGGGGGWSYSVLFSVYRRGSGGGGGWRMGIFTVTPGSNILCTIGAGGISESNADSTPGTSGGDTTFNGMTAKGGYASTAGGQGGGVGSGGAVGGGGSAGDSYIHQSGVTTQNYGTSSSHGLYGSNNSSQSSYQGALSGGGYGQGAGKSSVNGAAGVCIIEW